MLEKVLAGVKFIKSPCYKIIAGLINVKLRAVSSRIMIKQRSLGSVPDYAMLCSISEGILWINRLSIQ